MHTTFENRLYLEVLGAFFETTFFLYTILNKKGRKYSSPEITKVLPIIKCTCTVFTDNFRNISTNSSISVSVCRGSYDGYVKHERNDPMFDPWDSQGNEKMQFLLECKTKTF